MGEYEGQPPEAPAPEEEVVVPEEEGQKYDGGEIPRSEPSEQED